ncbi:glycosyltransferase family 4 protein [Candidatus Woesebacteria bacterium]|nr:glycosyltransferase family 4 protein [Candidatus Woesebacteria bacterium]
MHIGIDISQIVYEGTGVARFTYHLIKEILSKPSLHTWTFFFSSLKNELNADILREIQASDHQLIRWYVPPRLLSVLWNESKWRNHAPIPNKFDLFISSDWTQPPAKIAQHRATVVHDLVFKKLPETVDPLILSTQNKRLAHVVSECDLVWCDSKSTATDLKEFYPDIKGTVKVNYPGVVAPIMQESKPFPYVFKPQEYFFAVGKIEPRKNLQRLIEAFLEITQLPHYAHYHLVIAGPRGWDVATQALSRPQIHLLGAVSDSELARLYQNALAFVFPSLYEGFGIPPLEAMALECPVILSDVSSLPEIADTTSALFVNPHSVVSIRDAMIRVINDADLRASLIAAGKQNVSRFTYQHYVRNMLESIDYLVV